MAKYPSELLSLVKVVKKAGLWVDILPGMNPQGLHFFKVGELSWCRAFAWHRNDQQEEVVYLIEDHAGWITTTYVVENKIVFPIEEILGKKDGKHLLRQEIKEWDRQISQKPPASTPADVLKEDQSVILLLDSGSERLTTTLVEGQRAVGILRHIAQGRPLHDLPREEGEPYTTSPWTK